MIALVWVGIGLTPVALTLSWVWIRFTSYIRYKGGSPPGPLTALKVFGGEAVQASRLVRYGVVSAIRGDAPPDAGLGPPVVCVHGFTMNASNFRALRAELTRSGRASRVVSLGWPGRRVPDYAPRLAAVLAESTGPIDVVAHSMGGVVLRVVLREYPELAARVRRVITLGTPHRGTAGARGWLGWFAEPADLHRRSALLAQLPTLADLVPHAKILTVGATVDLVVYPPETTTTPGASHLELPVGHLGLVVDPGVAAQLARWLAAAS